MGKWELSTDVASDYTRHISTYCPIELSMLFSELMEKMLNFSSTFGVSFLFFNTLHLRVNMNKIYRANLNVLFKADLQIKLMDSDYIQGRIQKGGVPPPPLLR